MKGLSLNQILITTNHIFIGGVYIVSGWIGGSIGFGLSIIIRLELSLPGLIICSSIQYNSILTMHGIFMIFFMIMPLLIGGFGCAICISGIDWLHSLGYHNYINIHCIF